MAEATRRHMLKATVRLAALRCPARKRQQVQSSLASQTRTRTCRQSALHTGATVAHPQ